VSIVAVLAAAVLSYLLNVLVLRGVTGRTPLDVPNERSLHTQPVPRVGGIGIVAGLSASLLAVEGFGLVVGIAVALALLSLMDDWRPMPAVARLAGHLAAAAVLCLSAVEAGLASQFLLIVAVAWMTNLYNFMDGADGLAGGMAAIGFGACAIAAAIAGDSGLATVCACIVASSLAFLCFNFHPARIFMGDVGSIPLGFLAAALGVLGVQRGAWPWWFAAVVFAPFVVDASLTLLRRALRGERFWHAHRSHYYQRLVLMGWGHRRTALAEYALMMVTGAVALLALTLSPVGQVGALGALGIGYAVLAILVDRRWAAASPSQNA
jgi:UDP-N-acetylmuramyl pentapeptide phosphotransferase/UDP-N-acetylglucosamine-1-phosphate transferase